MSFFAQHPRARWAAPVLAAALMVGGVATAQSSAGGQSDLAQRTAHDLLVDLAEGAPDPAQRDRGAEDGPRPARPVRRSARWGGSGLAGALNPVTLLSGSHSWRVWFADPTHARLRSSTAPTSTTWCATARTSGSGPAPTHRWPTRRFRLMPRTRATRARRRRRRNRRRRHSRPVQPGCRRDLGAVPARTRRRPCTSTRTDRVARRSAYGLVLTPRTPGTRIGSVHLSLDAETSLPLAATVIPRGSTRPAVDVRFTTLTLARPAPSVFGFTPPPGAKVTTEGRDDGPAPRTDRSLVARPHVVGTGWSSVRRRRAAGHVDHGLVPRRRGRTRWRSCARSCRGHGRLGLRQPAHDEAVLGRRDRRRQVRGGCRRPVGPLRRPRSLTRVTESRGCRSPRSAPPGSPSASATRPPWPASTSTCPAARCTGSSARTGPARPRRSGCCSASCGPPPARSRCWARPSPIGPTSSCPASVRWSRAPGSIRTSAVPRTCGGSMPWTAPPTTPPPRSASRDALARVGLSSAADKRYRKYSLGMKQRLAIAAALLSPREILVLDEPTNGLDPQGTREIRSLIGELATRRGHGVRLQPPACRGGAGVLARRHHERRSARRPGNRSGTPGGASARPSR